MSTYDLKETVSDNAVIKVVGVGGGGCNAVEHMLRQNIEGVDFICANTDAQVLKGLSARHILQLGTQLTKGLGAGANPEVGKRAAQEDRTRIQELLNGADMVFITAGMGGGTGTGAAPVVAEIAKDMGILTVAVVTKPFPFEGRRRMQVADIGIAELADKVDSLITIPNEKLLTVLGKNVSLLDAFKATNNVLQGAVQGISELITRPGLINVDFADVKTVMSEMGTAMMGTATASGEDRAREAAEAAVASPLLEDVSLSGAKGVLVNITSGPNMSIGEFEEVGEVIKSFTSDQATVVVGTVIDPEMGDSLRVTIVVTGLSARAAADAPVLPTHRERVAAASAAAPVAAKGNAYRYTLGTQPSANAGSNGAPSLTSAKPRAQQQAPQEPKATERKASQDVNEGDYLDIPTFLRRKAD